MSWSNFPENWEKDAEIIEILDEDKIPKKLIIGENYHTSWQSNSRFRFKLLSYDNVNCKLQSHFNGNTFSCKITDLREINKRTLYNARQRIKKDKSSK